MAKKLLGFLTFIICFSAFSQDKDELQEATLYFRDGTNVLGYGDIKREMIPSTFPPKSAILFKASKKEEADSWDGELVDKVVFYGFEFERIFQFVPISYHGETRYRLLRVISEGEVTLYSNADEDYNKSLIAPNIDFPAVSPLIGGQISSRNYLVKRQNENEFTKFGGSKKKIAAYFNNCEGIVKKLNTNEFNIGTLVEIVEYYNDLCAGYTEDYDTEDTSDDK